MFFISNSESIPELEDSFEKMRAMDVIWSIKPVDFKSPPERGFMMRFLPQKPVDSNRVHKLDNCPMCAMGLKPSYIVPVRDKITGERMLMSMSSKMRETLEKATEGLENAREIVIDRGFLLPPW